MCGIAGIVKFDPRERVEEQRLVAMRDVLRHRGPDGEGVFLDGPAGLAHRRLAIVDVGAGHQPMANEDGSIWISFNGEIYNHADLRPSLEMHGHHFRTRCDTESILHLYEEKGDAVVEDLHGMFAFAMWDRRRQRLLLARDRLGIKPLYYTWTDTELLFASEIKALLAASEVPPAFNEDALPEFLATRFLSGEDTFFRNVRKLMPGHVASWSLLDGFKSRRYWQLPTPGAEDHGTIASRAVDVRARLDAAVRSHLMSDVPLGVFLSGGLDSSALAAMVARDVSRDSTAPIRTFAVGFAEREANELEFARLVARHIGSEHREVVVTPHEYFETLPHLIWHEDEPLAFTSSVPLYFVAKLASDHVKVVLTGEGADELFLGYNRYRATLWNARLGGAYWAGVPQPVRAGVRRLVEVLPRQVRRFAQRSFLAHDPGMRDLFLENFAVFADRDQRPLLRRAELLENQDQYSSLLHYDNADAGGLLDRMGHVDLQTYLLELLMKQDQMSMAASIESRVPFLDDHVVDYVAALPGRYKVQGWQTKAVLRSAIGDLVPKAILARRKMGFPVPFGRWLRGAFSPIVDEFVLGPRAAARRLFNRESLQQLASEHRSGHRAHGERLWLLVNLEIWLRIFFDGEHPSDVMRGVWNSKSRTSYANALGENGGTVAGEYRRPRQEPADRVGALAATSGHAGHHPRLG
jgi:asparagine synthase (glutamine-hydrolysing)